MKKPKPTKSMIAHAILVAKLRCRIHEMNVELSTLAEDDPCAEELTVLVQAEENLLTAELHVDAVYAQGAANNSDAESLRDAAQLLRDSAQAAYDLCVEENQGSGGPPP